MSRDDLVCCITCGQSVLREEARMIYEDPDLVDDEYICEECDTPDSFGGDFSGRDSGDYYDEDEIDDLNGLF